MIDWLNFRLIRNSKLLSHFETVRKKEKSHLNLNSNTIKESSILILWARDFPHGCTEWFTIKNNAKSEEPSSTWECTDAFKMDRNTSDEFSRCEAERRQTRLPSIKKVVSDGRLLKSEIPNFHGSTRDETKLEVITINQTLPSSVHKMISHYTTWIISYHITPYYIISHQIKAYHIMHVISSIQYHIKSHHAISHYVMSYDIIS